MISKDDAASPPERDRTANRRWMIGIVLSLVFGIFGALMALLSYMDQDRQTTIYRTMKAPGAPAVAPGASPPTAPAVAPGVSPPATSGDPAPAGEDDKGKGKGKDKN